MVENDYDDGKCGASFFKRCPDPNVETSEMEAMQVYEGSE